MGQLKPNQGALHPNENKTKDTQPDMKGSVITEDGEKYEAAGWWNNYPASNDQYLKLKLTKVISSDPGYDPKLNHR